MMSGKFYIFVSGIFLLAKLTKIVYSQSADTSTVSTSTLEPAYSLVLDIQNDIFISWDVSTTDFEDWFYYYDSLDNLTDAATLYFNGIDLQSLNVAEGVWAAFNSRMPPNFGEPFPIIKLGQTFRTFDILEITYCTYGNASIRLYLDKDTIELHSDESLTWKTFSVSLINGNQFEIELVANTSEKAFILIDKVMVNSFPVTVPTTVRPSTVRPSTVELVTSLTEKTTLDISFTSESDTTGRSTSTTHSKQDNGSAKLLGDANQSVLLLVISSLMILY